MKLLIVNNIPTPYRNYMFSVLHEELAKRSAELVVYFMAETESGRYWSFDPSKWVFNGSISPGIHLWLRTPRRASGFPVHFNPDIWLNVRRERPTWLLLAGSWHMPTTAGLLMMKRWLPRTHILLWSEANVRASHYHRGLVASLRKFVMSRADGFVIPGTIAESALEHWQIPSRNLIRLPNLVDEKKFHDGALRGRENRKRLHKKYNISESNHVLLWCARLNEENKGFINFLEAIEPVFHTNTTLLIAGDGPARRRVEDWLRSHRRLDIRLLGHLPQEQIIELQAISDIALLPSKHDPNPLTIIEAMWAGLPLLTSVNCGNFPETVVPGINGWLVDPSDPQSLRSAMKEIQECSLESLARMGQESLRLAKQRFSSRDEIRRFVEQLFALFPAVP